MIPFLKHVIYTKLRTSSEVDIVAVVLVVVVIGVGLLFIVTERHFAFSRQLAPRGYVLASILRKPLLESQMRCEGELLYTCANTINYHMVPLIVQCTLHNATILCSFIYVWIQAGRRCYISTRQNNIILLGTNLCIRVGSLHCSHYSGISALHLLHFSITVVSEVLEGICLVKQLLLFFSQLLLHTA